MIFYRIFDKGSGTEYTLGWARTQADAKADAKAKNAEWRQEEVPTDSKGLCEWLNRNAVTPEYARGE